MHARACPNRLLELLTPYLPRPDIPNPSAEKMLGPCRSSTYAGADLFLSTHWGQRVAAGYDLGTL